MKITLSNISFNGGTQELESNKPKRRNYYGKIFEPVDNGDIRTNKRGNVYPTAFEDCFEKMTFEEDIEDNMWRDAQYVDEFERVSHAGDDLTAHIIHEEPFVHKYYSNDDIPLADSIIRRTLNISPYADVELDFDTDMDSHQIMVLNKINYKENIIPNLIPGADYETINQFAQLVAVHEVMGYPSSRINSSIERCRLINPKSSYQEPQIKLYEFLLDNPNYRSLVVQKTPAGKEIFDSTYATYFKNDYTFLIISKKIV